MAEVNFPQRKTNDTAPSEFILTTKKKALDLGAGVSGVRFIMKPLVAQTGNFVDSTCEIGQVGAGDDAIDKGLVRYLWQAEDVAHPGMHRAEFEVTWDDGTIETFPEGGYVVIEFLQDLA